MVGTNVGVRRVGSAELSNGVGNACVVISAEHCNVATGAYNRKQVKINAVKSKILPNWSSPKPDTNRSP